jgi:hypothetical protein
MRITLLGLLCGLALASPLAAQQDAPSPPVAPSHLAVARQYLELIGMQEVAMTGVQLAMDEQIATTPELKPYRAVMVEWARDLFASEEAKNGFATILAQTFSEADLRELIAFAQTPLGRRLFAQQGELARRGAELGQRLAEAHQADLIERLERVQPGTKPR